MKPPSFVSQQTTMMTMCGSSAQIRQTRLSEPALCVVDVAVGSLWVRASAESRFGSCIRDIEHTRGGQTSRNTENRLSVCEGSSARNSTGEIVRDWTRWRHIRTPKVFKRAEVQLGTTEPTNPKFPNQTAFQTQAHDDHRRRPGRDHPPRQLTRLLDSTTPTD